MVHFRQMCRDRPPSDGSYPLTALTMFAPRQPLHGPMSADAARGVESPAITLRANTIAANIVLAPM
jgi:hypothetical protein